MLLLTNSLYQTYEISLLADLKSSIKLILFQHYSLYLVLVIKESLPYKVLSRQPFPLLSSGSKVLNFVCLQ